LPTPSLQSSRNRLQCAAFSRLAGRNRFQEPANDSCATAFDHTTATATDHGNITSSLSPSGQTHTQGSEATLPGGIAAVGGGRQRLTTVSPLLHASATCTSFTINESDHDDSALSTINSYARLSCRTETIDYILAGDSITMELYA
jgi:hypothetical protein